MTDGLPGLGNAALPVSAALPPAGRGWLAAVAVLALEALRTLAAVRLALGNAQAMDTPGGGVQESKAGCLCVCVCVTREHTLVSLFFKFLVGTAINLINQLLVTPIETDKGKPMKYTGSLIVQLNQWREPANPSKTQLKMLY